MIDALSIIKTPRLARIAFPAALWKIPTNQKKIFLTFDDGPTPEVTHFVLEELKKYHALATFFCIGKNIQLNPSIFQTILAENHAVGNHTFNHLNGWKTLKSDYLQDAILGQNEIEKYTTTKLFRPPYGKLTFAQYNHIKRFHKIVMWDVLSYDFDLSVTKETVLKNVMNNAENGSIIVLHDSVKASDKLFYTLPKVLAFFSEMGYSFETLKDF